jgi:hypothetical protein
MNNNTTYNDKDDTGCVKKTKKNEIRFPINVDVSSLEAYQKIQYSTKVGRVIEVFDIVSKQKMKSKKMQIELENLEFITFNDLKVLSYNLSPTEINFTVKVQNLLCPKNVYY